MRFRFCAIVVIAACARGGQTSSIPRISCEDCPSPSTGAIGTQSTLKVSTSWEADCWDAPAGVFPVTSNSEKDTHRTCNRVDHVPKLACSGGECTIVPLSRDTNGPREYQVVVKTPGDVELYAKMQRVDGKKPGYASYKLKVARPTELETACSTSSGKSVVWATLKHDGKRVVMGSPLLTMTVGNVTCQTPSALEHDRAEIAFSCPFAERTPVVVTVTGKDFTLSKETTCQ